MIIDGHAHTYPDSAAGRVVHSFLDFHHMEPTDSVGTGTVDDLRQKMKQSRTDYTVLANFAPRKSLRRTNEWTLSVSKVHDDLIPLISVVPGFPVSEMMEYFDSGAKGIKMHTGIQNFEPDDPELASIYSFCNERRIPVTFHCGETSRVHMNEFAEMSHIIPVVRKYESIPFVLTHLASGDPETVIQIAEECPNVIFDTSIALTGECCIHRIHDHFWEDDRNTYELIRKIGAERFAFGSDYPFGNPVSDIARIRNLGLSESETEKILGLNTYRLYFENEFLNEKDCGL